jgi:hypothetical protein
MDEALYNRIVERLHKEQAYDTAKLIKTVQQKSGVRCRDTFLKVQPPPAGGVVASAMGWLMELQIAAIFSAAPIEGNSK